MKQTPQQPREPNLPKVTTFGVVKRNNLFHVVALQTQGRQVLQEQVVAANLGSIEQGWDEMRIAADFHYIANRPVLFP